MKVDGKPVNVDFVLDLEKNTFVVTVGGVSHLGPTFSSTVNLHDFNMVCSLAIYFTTKQLSDCILLFCLIPLSN